MAAFARWRRQSTAPADRAAPLEQPIAYVVMRAGTRWLGRVCKDRAEAVAEMNALDEMGAEMVFAGEAAAPRFAHWQMREVLGQYAGGGIGPMPWTAYPRSRSMGGNGMNVPMLRDSFERAMNADPQLCTHFYQRLFAARPDVRRYFPASMRAQERALGEKLVEVMLHLEEPEYLRAHLPALGSRHATMYRVTPDMFQPVALALIDTLEVAVGGWGTERDALRREWVEGLNAIAVLMLSGFPNPDRAALPA